MMLDIFKVLKEELPVFSLNKGVSSYKPSTEDLRSLAVDKSNGYSDYYATGAKLDIPTQSK